MGRNVYIQLRVSPEEKALIQAAARTAGLKTSEFIRREAGIGRFTAWGIASVKKEPGQRTEPGHVKPEDWTGEPEEHPNFEGHFIRQKLKLPTRAARNVARRLVEGEMAG